MKAEGLPDIEEAAEEDSELAEGLMGSLEVPYWGQDTVHAVYRDWHAVLAEYEGEAAPI